MAGGSAASNNPSDRRYTSEHEWIKPDQDDVYTVGITAFAQDQLGDIVYVELPSVGQRVEAGGTFGVVESVKTASDLYSPVAGEVVAINEALTDEPQVVNDDPYSKGWMIKVRPDKPADVESLLSAEQYAREVGG